MAHSQTTLPNKMYFKIGEVSQITGVKPYILRYWESEFRLIRPQKSKLGQRVYRQQDIENILRLKKLLYTERYTISGAKQKLEQEATPKGLTAPKKPEDIRAWQKNEIKELLRILEK